MRYLFRQLGVACVAAALAGCMSHGPGGVAYSRGDTNVGDTNVGGTSGAAGGTVSGGSVRAAEPAEKEQRGNTPPGVDRDGHGPAAGAIVDPTGAATRGRPY